MTAIALLTLISRPLIGGIIGYITNDIAIRMLFRPHTAKYIFGIHVPFTPGIIPKEKNRIAAAIGGAISENLINQETLEQTLLSERITDRIRQGVNEFFEAQAENNATLYDFLLDNMSDQQLYDIRNNLSEGIRELIARRLAEAPLGRSIAEAVTEHVVERIRNNTGILSSRLGLDNLARITASALQPVLTKSINLFLNADAAPMIVKFFDTQTEELLQTPMSQLVRQEPEKIKKLTGMIVGFYRSIVIRKLPSALATLDISRIIQDKISSMDVAESEQLIRSVMNRELKALVWLGALLGTIMGCINLLF